MNSPPVSILTTTPIDAGEQRRTQNRIMPEFARRAETRKYGARRGGSPFPGPPRAGPPCAGGHPRSRPELIRPGYRTSRARAESTPTPRAYQSRLPHTVPDAPLRAGPGCELIQPPGDGDHDLALGRRLVERDALTSPSEVSRYSCRGPWPDHCGTSNSPAYSSLRSAAIPRASSHAAKKKGRGPSGAPSNCPIAATWNY
jgi:hypothetical protein